MFNVLFFIYPFFAVVVLFIGSEMDIYLTHQRYKSTLCPFQYIHFRSASDGNKGVFIFKLTFQKQAIIRFYIQNIS